MNPPNTSHDPARENSQDNVSRDEPATTLPGPGSRKRDGNETLSAGAAHLSGGTAGEGDFSVNELPDELTNHPRYEVPGVLGSGGMGTVYKARHRSMDRLVALKIVRPALLSRPDVVMRFEREVRLAARLAHPNIVTAFDAETSGPFHFLVMEFVPGENLADVVAAEAPLPVARACEYARQAALGLQYAFRRGMVHRDIKPSNLIRTRSPDGDGEVVKILDFGLSRLAREMQESPPEDVPVPLGPPPEAPAHPESHTTPGARLGTWRYMAPEQAEDPRGADIRADIYSLGCTLYHLLTGRPPFRRGSGEELRQRHRAEVPRPVTEIRPDVPAALSAVVAKMLAKDPGRRFQTPAEVAEALAPYSTPPTAEPPAGESLPPPPRRRRSRRALLAGAVLGLVAAGGAGLLAYRQFHPAPPAGPPDGSSAQVLTSEERRLEAHAGPIWSVAYSPDGRSLLSAGTEGEVFVWDLTAERGRPRKLSGHTGRVRAVSFSPDGRLALSAGEDGTARVWEPATGRETVRFTPERYEALTSAAFSPDGQTALTGGHRSIWLWDVATGRVRRRLPHAAEGVAFSPEGRFALTGSYDDFTVYVWDLESGEVRHALSEHTAGVKSVAFSRDGRRILSGAEDRMMVLWDAASGQRLRSWKGHRGLIWAVAFTPDGRRAFSTGWDRTARLWDLEDGRELQRFAPDSQEFCCGTVSPDGRLGTCAGADKMIYLWRLPP